MTRKKVPTDYRQQVLHEAGYHCANPACRMVLTLDVHHMVSVSQNGSSEPSNLLPLCPNCHALHHKGVIPQESIRTWKMLLLALNDAFDRRQTDLLLMLDRVKQLWISSEGVVDFAGLLAAGMVCLYEGNYSVPITNYHVALTEKGGRFVAGWKNGKQEDAIQLGSHSETAPIIPAEIGYERLNWGSRSQHAATLTTADEGGDENRGALHLTADGNESAV